jgi:phage terminase large subunit-like protein
MPRRVIKAPGHTRKNALRIAVWWIEQFTVHGPGDIMGRPTVLPDEYAKFVIDCYALDAFGRRLYDSAFLSRPKGCDKSGIAAKIALLEAFGPARFAGYAKGGETYEFLGKVYVYAPGEPMGQAVTSPVVRIMATEETQAGNVYKTIYYNLNDAAAPLFQLQAFGVQVGLNRIVIPWGGEIVRSTAGAASKDGGNETFAVFDETHLYTTPVLHEMYTTVTNNLEKRKMTAEPWFIETTTMYAPGEESVAESTYELAEAIDEGRARRARLLFDHRWGDVVDFTNEALLKRAFEEAYGDAIEWNPVEHLLTLAYDIRRKVQTTRRYFLNAVVGSVNAWVEPEQWAARSIVLLRKTADGSFEWSPPGPGDVITLGFDGSRSNDATALIGCRVRDRYLFPIKIAETPDGPEAEGYQVDRVAFDAAVSQAFNAYRVVGFYADPPLWQDYVDAWAKEYEDQLLVEASTKSAIEWWTKADTKMAPALERLHTAILTGTVTHSADPVMTRHFLNAREWSRRSGTVIGKEKKNSPKKIDAAVAATLAFEAAADWLDHGRPVIQQSMVPERVR